MNVRSLYSNIKHNDGISALKESLENRISKEPPTEVITTLTNHILTLNNFNFHGRRFLQIKGYAMGTVAAHYLPPIIWDILKKPTSIQK